MSEELNQNEETTPEAVVNTEAAAEAAPVATETPAPVVEVEVVAEAPATVPAVEMDEEEGELDLTVVEEEEAFDWDKYESSNKHDSAYLEMEKRYEATLTTSVEHQVVSGVVVNKSDRDVIIDIGSKSEGVVSMNEFRYNPDLKVGDLVEVLVDKQEDKLGQLVLSHRKARSIKAWDRVNDAFLNEEVVQGYVKCRTKGGMIVDVFGLEAFLPGSQIDVKPIRDYDIFVDKTMEFKIVKINQEFKNVVVSHKALIEADLEEQKRKIIGQLEKGQVLEGVVKNITSYGVFIDLGGVDGLVHITDLSWSRISHPSEVVELDQRLNVVILDFDEAKTRIQLGLKQLFPHPWEALTTQINEGDRVKGKVVVLADYGAFVEIQPGVEGLVHVSEMSWGTHLRSAQDFVKVGQEVETIVLGIDREDRKMSLGIKQLTPDPWASITAKYPLNSTHKGTVRNFTNFGVFLELEEGIDGLIHISDLSWTKKVKHPSEFTSVGAIMEVNPSDNYEAVFEVGTSHTGKVTEAVDKGFNVMFETFGVEGFCPARHASKEDGSNFKVGDVLEFKVLEFNRDSRRILVSHAQTHKEMPAEEKSSGGGSKGKKSNSGNSGINEVNAAVGKTTLGDLDALLRLKDQMDNNA